MKFEKFMFEKLVKFYYRLIIIIIVLLKLYRLEYKLVYYCSQRLYYFINFLRKMSGNYPGI